MAFYAPEPTRFVDNVTQGNNWTDESKTISSSRAPESAKYADDTYGLDYGPKSVYQVPWPYPVYSTIEAPNHINAQIDPLEGQIKYMDYSTEKDREEIFIGGKVPTSAGIPIFDPAKAKYKFRRPYSKR